MRVFKTITTFVFALSLLFLNVSNGEAFSDASKSFIEVKRVFEQQKCFLNEAKIDNLKVLYADDYLSNDGFDKNTLFQLYQDTLKNHPDIKYDIFITKITVDGDYATVKTVNKSKATTLQKSPITNDSGLLSVDMETIFYLQKKCGLWQIVAEQTISERTSLLYGECKNADIKLFAPEFISTDKEYTVGLEVPEKYAKFAMGSIKKELITYPSEDPGDIFKVFDSSGLIERIFQPNLQEKNETIAASVAFATPSLTGTNNLDLKISGIGVLLQRVNLYSAPQNRIKNEK
jgi:hypothetical protein